MKDGHWAHQLSEDHGQKHATAPSEGRTLSFADKLKKRKKGTSQTHTPKKVATSINDSCCKPAYLFPPYLLSYAPVRYPFRPYLTAEFECSFALSAK
jgi:hypothetical protein